MKSVDQPPPPEAPKRFTTLRNKVFLPFALLTVFLCGATILGSVELAKRSFKNSVDERLAAAHEVLFREFKKQESLLQTYAIIMQQFQSLSETFRSETELGILEDRLYNTLEDSNISTAFYPADVRGIIQQESMISLFDQVRRSDMPRFRYTNEFGGIPVLMVAAPIRNRGEVTKILLLQTAMGDKFLHQVTSSLKVAASLMTIDGQVMARGSSDFTDLKLTPAQTTMIGDGHPLYLDHQGKEGDERHLFSVIPLGRSDLVMLALEASLSETSDRQDATILSMVLAMLMAVLICTILYFRRITIITRPAQELRHAAEAISRGNLNYRIHDISNDELGQIALTFNHMTTELESSYQTRAHQDIATAIAFEESKMKLVLEKKERERDRLNSELNNIQRETTALYQLNQAMTAAIEPGALFDRILQILNEVLTCDHIVLLAHNPGESVLEVVRTSGLEPNVLDKIKFSFNQGVTGEAANSQRMIYIKNIDEDNRNLSYHGQIVTRGSMISAPLLFKGRLVGAINLHNREIDAYSTSEQKLVQAIANQTAIALYNAQITEKNRELSSTDELTGLSNRRYFQEVLKREVAQARRFNSNFSIIMCDIDNFKQHKSTLGNIHADALLRQVGKTLLKSTRGIDMVSRFGNDQFIIMLTKTGKKGGLLTAEKLRRNINAEDFSVQINLDQSIKVTLSFGVTEFPRDSKNIYELLNLADRALYASKKEGGNCCVAWEGVAPGPE